MSSETPTDAPADPVARAEELERRLAEVERAARERLIRADLKAEALRAGMVDLDGLRLIDTKDLVLDANGDVQGATVLMREMRAQKPWLFGTASSSSAAPAPPAQTLAPKQATEMTYEEWQSARSEMLRRR
jgi:hypothetical protein